MSDIINRSDAALRVLYEQLLKLADREDQALTADNLDELEACMRRKEEVFKKVREIESKQDRNDSSKTSREVVLLIEQVAARHERVTEKIRAMTGECQQAILELQTGRRAHRAYYQARKRRSGDPARLL